MKESRRDISLNVYLVAKFTVISDVANDLDFSICDKTIYRKMLGFKQELDWQPSVL